MVFNFTPKLHTLKMEVLFLKILFLISVKQKNSGKLIQKKKEL